MEAEKRRALRRSLEYPAGIAAGDGSPVQSCFLSDVSETGARVRVTDPAQFPATVMLILSRNGVFRRCRVAWRNESSLGLEFLDAKEETLNRTPFV